MWWPPASPPPLTCPFRTLSTAWRPQEGSRFEHSRKENCLRLVAQSTRISVCDAICQVSRRDPFHGSVWQAMYSTIACHIVLILHSDNDITSWRQPLVVMRVMYSSSSMSAVPAGQAIIFPVTRLSRGLTVISWLGQC